MTFALSYKSFKIPVTVQKGLPQSKQAFFFLSVFKCHLVTKEPPHNFICILISANAAHEPPPPEAKKLCLCHASPDFLFFFYQNLLYAVRKTFGTCLRTFWKFSLEIPRSTSCKISCDSFPPGMFWLSKFTYHISASLQWYQICWITGLGYCIIYFALIEVLVETWFPIMHWNIMFISLFMVFAAGV